jgi:PAS domain S-box-containing protein
MEKGFRDQPGWSSGADLGHGGGGRRTSLQDAPKIDTGSRSRLSPASLTAVYAVTGALWILFSDRLAAGLAGTPDALSRLQTAKGWFFILVTSAILYGMLRRYASARQRQETRLREERNLLNAIVEGTTDAIFVKDRDGRYLLVNTACARIFAKPKKEAVGETDARLFPPGMAQDILERDRGILESGATITFEEEVPVGGRTTPFLTTKGVVRDTSGNKTGIFGIARDISDIKAAQKTLQEREALLKNVLEILPVGVWIADRSGKIVHGNPAGQAILAGARYVGVDQFGKYKGWWHDTGKPILAEEWGMARALTRGETSVGEEIDIECFDGSRKAILHSATPLRDPSGEIVGGVVVIMDITEHLRLTAQYQQAQKMESVGTLAGGIAHDFNNILSAIIGYGHVALMKMAQDDPQRLNIESMLEAADRAAHLTKDLLLFSRKRVGERKPVDLNEVVGKVDKFLKRIIGEDIECETVRHGTPIPVHADSQQIEQVLMNLATNARDAMPRGGTFTVRTEQVHLNESFTAAHGFGKPGAYGTITVSDTGKGMDEETRKRLFEPFFTTKEVGKGTGLGLAVVYGIIKQHDGFINVYSEPGTGTTFRIYLPIIASAGREGAKAHREEAPGRGTETILLAEDDKSVRNIVNVCLAEFGYTVIEAVDGEDAVRKFTENMDHIHLLLFDLIMPKMNGKEAYDEVRKIKPGVKIIFASGYAPDILQQKASLENGASLIFKPFSPFELARKVRSALDGGT